MVTHENETGKGGRIVRQFGALSIVFLSIIWVFTPEACAQRFYKAGYEIDIMWQVQSKEFKIWGDFEKGKSCKRIDLDVQFKNFETKQLVGMETSTKNSHNSRSRSWFTEERKTSTKKRRKSWRIEWFQFTCINEDERTKYLWER